MTQERNKAGQKVGPIGNHLFVYGTLMRGGSLHSELTGAGVRFVGSAKIHGRLFNIPGEDYPGAIPASGEEFVHGELYELENPRAALQRIDEVEGCNEGLFVRKRVPVWSKGRRSTAWAYFFNLPHKKLVPIKNGRYGVHS